MENATKALIIAASMLIAIMVISIGVYLFATMSGYTTSAQKKIIDDRVVAFNNKFLIYDGKEDLTVHDIITVANYARQSNENYGLSENSRSDTNSYYVSVIWEKVNIETQQIKNESAETFLNKLFILFSSLNTIISTVLNIDFVYVLQGTTQYITTDSPAVLGLVSQTMHGIALFLAPTSTMLLLGIEYLDISYKEWLKASWKLVLELLLIALIIIIIVTFI